MHIPALLNASVMASYCHKDLLTKSRSSDRSLSTCFAIPTKVSPERPLRPIDCFTNGQTHEKCKLTVNSQNRTNSGSSTFSSYSTPSSPPVSKQMYSCRSKTELELRRPSIQVVEADGKRVGCLGDSPKWSRIKETFEGSESQCSLNKAVSQSTSSLTRPLGKQLTVATVRRTESCDRGSYYRPRRTASGTEEESSATKPNRTVTADTLVSRQRHYNTDRDFQSKTLPPEVAYKDTRTTGGSTVSRRSAAATEEEPFVAKSKRTVAAETLVTRQRHFNTDCDFRSKTLQPEVTYKDTRSTEGSSISRKSNLTDTRTTEGSSLSSKSSLLDTRTREGSSLSRKNSSLDKDSSSETSSKGRNYSAGIESKLRITSCDTHKLKVSRTKNSQTSYSDSELKSGYKKSLKSENSDLQLSRVNNFRNDAVTRVPESPSTLPDMDSINSLKSYLKEIQDSKLRRQKFLKYDIISKEPILSNFSIPSSSLSSSLDTRLKFSKPLSTESLDAQTEKMCLDRRKKTTQSYLHTLEETRLSRLNIKAKLTSAEDGASVTITSQRSRDESLVTEVSYKSGSTSPLLKSEEASSLCLSPTKLKNGALTKSQSACSSPLSENKTVGKLSNEISIHGSINNSKSKLPGWKMTSSGSWIKVTMEKEVLASSLKSKVALLAHQFDQFRNFDENPKKDLVLYKNSSSSGELEPSCQTLESFCCPVFKTNKSKEDCEPTANDSCKDKVITTESKQLGLVKQVVQNFEETVQKSVSPDLELSPTASMKGELMQSPKMSTKQFPNKSLIKADRENIKNSCENVKRNPASPRPQRNLKNDSKTQTQLEKEDRRYSTFTGKSKLPANHKLTVPPRLTSLRNNPSPVNRNVYQRPSVPPPRKPPLQNPSDVTKNVNADKGELSLLAELEMWLVQKYDKKEQQERQPNHSFLWKRGIPHQNVKSADYAWKPENKESPSPGYYSRPFTRSAGDDEHIYMEAFSPALQQGFSSSEHYAPGSSCDSDEGWVDVDDIEVEPSGQGDKEMVHLRSHPRNIKAHCYRRSWVQSIRDKTSNEEQWTQEDYKNVTVWETDEVDNSSSSSSNSDHLYETLYDVIAPEEQVGNHENLLSPSNDSGIKDTSIVSESVDESNDFQDPEPQPVKSDHGLKRNWSLTKSDIRLELTSNLNKVKVRKDSKSITDVSEPQSDSEIVTSKKKTLIKFILRQKNAAPVKKRAHKKGATFYVRWSQKRNDSLDEDPSLEVDCNETDRPGAATIKRRPSNCVRRPTTPPPLPPVAGSQVRMHEGSRSLEILRSSSNVPSKEKAMSLDSAQNLKLNVGNKDAPCRTDSFNRSSFSSSQGSCSPSSSSQSSHEASNGSFFLMTPRTRSSVASSVSSHSGSSYIPEEEVASIPRPPCSLLPITHEECNYLQLHRDQIETLHSPFEEEPLYQFYTKRVKQRATKLQSLMTMDEDHEENLCGNKSVHLQNQNSSPASVSSGFSGIPSAMELLHHDVGNQRTLWCEVPEVRASGVLDKITSQERKLQEAMFEVITSEASYLKSLTVLIEHFMDCPEFCDDFSMNCVLGRRERHILFSDVIPVRDVSARLLNDLEHRWQENVLISNICDILYEHASKFFSVYVKYCANQVYQDRILKEMKATRPDFVSVLQRLESNPVCQGLDMLSFLMLPMQRITRMPLLVDAIFHRLSTDSPYYDICKLTLVTLNKVVAECNEAARKMERMEEMLVISRQLDFKDCKSIPLISASRWLVKKGELVRLVSENFGRSKTFGRSTRFTKISLYLFLFTDLLLVAKKKSDDAFVVLDYCPRNLVQVFTLEDAGVSMTGKIPETHKNVFQLTMLQNHEFKTVEMILGCPLESDRTRWMEAVTPPVSDNPEEKIYEEWDCPQVQCIYPYHAKQPDELTLEESDVVNVFRKMPDGWHEGERLRDGIKGWFPASFTVEIISSHIRARNLRQRYRLLMLSQAYVEEQRRAFLLDKSDKSK